jgi:hypothetical protein
MAGSAAEGGGICILPTINSTGNDYQRQSTQNYIGQDQQANRCIRTREEELLEAIANLHGFSVIGIKVFGGVKLTCRILVYSYFLVNIRMSLLFRMKVIVFIRKISSIDHGINAPRGIG